MNRLRLVAVAAIMGAIAMFSASPAQAACPYVDVVVELTADSPVVGGKAVNFTATTSSGDIDGDFTVTFDGAGPGDSGVRTGSGTSFSGSFESKVVSESTPTTMTASFDCGDGGAEDSATVILLPVGDVGGVDDGNNDGGLPDTGGTNLSWLLIGGALVLVGGGATYAARRRHTAR